MLIRHAEASLVSGQDQATTSAQERVRTGPQMVPRWSPELSAGQCQACRTGENSALCPIMARWAEKLRCMGNKVSAKVSGKYMHVAEACGRRVGSLGRLYRFKQPALGRSPLSTGSLSAALQVKTNALCKNKLPSCDCAEALH